MFFVTGTNTEIGKTFASTLLFRYFHQQGKRCVIMKPIASSENNPSEDADTIFTCLASSGVPLNNKDKQDIAPITYPRPYAPYALEGSQITELKDKLLSSFNRLKKKFSIIIVEGIGGALVPIEKDFFTLDIAKLFNIPTIVVAEDKLGAINHTLLTFEAIQSRGIIVSGFIMNRFLVENEKKVKNNVQVIEEISGIPCIGKIIDGQLKEIIREKYEL
ncbi:MAG: dethiobiotin synthase [Nitrospinae bacterium]|nr:dethiobiotin synthase [Nitrospinota bacterium]